MAVKLEWRPIHQRAQEPGRKRETDAAYDLYAVQGVNILPHDYNEVPIGIEVSAPPGYYYTIEGRSGMLKQGIIAMRGIIDATYTGQVFVVLYNVSGNVYHVKIGDRVAQMILHKMHDVNFEKVEEFSPAYDQRGKAGWGSSGS
jgi:dUTP pyrophosphatase